MIRIALAALLLGALAQPEKPCDLARTELRDYCLGCKGWPPSEQIDKGNCRKCKGKVEKAETCVKVCWDCPAAHGKPARHAKPCGASEKCCREIPCLALVTYVCDACKGMARKEADVRHSPDTCAGKIRRTCVESGKFPHGGEE